MKDVWKGLLALLVLGAIAAAVYFGFFYEPPVAVAPEVIILPSEVMF